MGRPGKRLCAASSLTWRRGSRWLSLAQRMLFCSGSHIQVPACQTKVKLWFLNYERTDDFIIRVRFQSRIKTTWLIFEEYFYLAIISSSADFADGFVRRVSGRANSVPTLLRMAGTGSPGAKGISGGSSPVNSPSFMHSSEKYTRQHKSNQGSK